jgi:hypothetical protein
MAHPKETAQPKDFMPSEWAKKAAVTEKPKPRNRQKVADEIRATMQNWLKGSNG